MDFFDDSYPLNHQRPRGNTVQWLGSDTPDACKAYYPNPYSNTNITYALNEYGFRSDPFVPNKHSMIFLGCSNTKGIGLPLEETFSYIIYTEIKKRVGIGLPYWNLGLAGCGLDTISRAFFRFRKLLNPQVVIALLPAYRLEFIVDAAWQSATMEGSNYNKIFERNRILVEPSVRLYNTQKNLAFIDLILSENKSLLIWDTWDKKNYLPNPMSKLDNFQNFVDSWHGLHIKHENLPKARDGLHSGKIHHREFAECILSNFGDQICKRLVSNTF